MSLSGSDLKLCSSFSELLMVFAKVFANLEFSRFNLNTKHINANTPKPAPKARLRTTINDNGA